MAQILDRDTKNVLIKITMSEYKKLETLDFFSHQDNLKDNWETIVDFGEGVSATEVLSSLKSSK